MHTLYPELIQEIVSYLGNDGPSLCSLCRCSKRFLRSCRQALYRDIVFTDIGSYGPPFGVRSSTSPALLPTLFTTLLRLNPSLASYVRGFYMAAQSARLCAKLSETREDVIAGLKHMVNLKALQIHLREDNSGAAAWKQAILGCTFQLEYFCASFDASEMFNVLPSDISHLRELRIRLCTLSDPSYSKVRFPRLERLGGNVLTVQQILPNCPSVSSLIWDMSIDGATSLVPLSPVLVRGFENLCRVCIRSSWCWEIGGLAPFLPHLEILHLVMDFSGIMYAEASPLVLTDE
ncbi:hypothetical protein NP233_g8613 [Leucocoprinus birnbaumii]|uniref:F-box domain-containing protein n=1 Tax=Leucocoprinus birnbaumii TaxID=56174 RepID=A0AAD5VLZ1_9AGAR|nr:hypothetical protein NP233_g8613 [Leucocoprinus birnbaumii]